MAEAQREGGVYRVGRGDSAKWVDANGKETSAPSRTESAATQSSDTEEDTYPYADLLSSGGFRDWDAVSAATDEQLIAINGIGPARVKEIRAYKPQG